ncbi:hypothetical protein NDU88_002596 [Pleurodeles waltl]|uniref:Uncharacterized protein n=1 Tax=Pleurodeles waltl TaxID=8319 RepID=A0AAV7W515_PLEWA|nr:hypothetical protein NDU88_002596 [Pleurodeles waltl]
MVQRPWGEEKVGPSAAGWIASPWEDGRQTFQAKDAPQRLCDGRGVVPTGITVLGGQHSGTSEWHRRLFATPRWKPREEEAGKCENRQERAQGQLTSGEYEGDGLEAFWLEYDEESVEEGEIRDDMEKDEQDWWEGKTWLLTM